MESGRSKAILLGILAAWAGLAAPVLSDQWRRNTRVRDMLSAATPDERARAVDNPAFEVAHQIAKATPNDACVAVAAYAGPAAVDYYNARFDYLLYPRRVSVYAGWNAPASDCDYVAVLRDTPQNLRSEPFAGEWDEAALVERTAVLESLFRSDRVSLYRRP